MLKKMNKYLGKKCLGDQGNIINGNLGKQTDWNCRDFVFSHLFSFSHLVASGLFYLPQPLTTLSCTFSSHFLWHNCHHPGVKANFWLLSVKSDSKSDLSVDCVFCSLLDIFMLISLELFRSAQQESILPFLSFFRLRLPLFPLSLSQLKT